MKTLSYRGDMRVLGCNSSNSSKPGWNTLETAKIKSRETSKQGITVGKTTSNQIFCSQKSSISDFLEIPDDMNKISLTGILNMAN